MAPPVSPPLKSLPQTPIPFFCLKAFPDPWLSWWGPHLPGISIAPQSGASTPSRLGFCSSSLDPVNCGYCICRRLPEQIHSLISWVCMCCFLPQSLSLVCLAAPPHIPVLSKCSLFGSTFPSFSPQHEFIVHTAKGTSSRTLHLTRQPWAAQPCLSSQLPFQGPSVNSLVLLGLGVWHTVGPQ